jgi:hypothetical protein
MPETERLAMAAKLGIVTCDGHELSLCNTILCAMQLPGVSVVGGFRQWLKHGRAVMKGQHGAMIWVPCGARKASGAEATPEITTEGECSDERQGFILGTVFDIGQTQEIEHDQPVAVGAVLANIIEQGGLVTA